MPGQRKRSKSVSSASRTLYYDKNNVKDLIEKKYAICHSFDDLYNEEYIELSPLAKSEKSKNFLLKLISNFDKKNKYKFSGEKDANNEFLRQSFIKAPIPRIISHYHDSSNKPIQSRDKIDKILSNKKPILSRRYAEICQREIEVDDCISTVEPISTIVKKINENKKENWNNKKEQWNDIIVNKKANQKKTIKEVLGNLMRVNKNANKHKYEETQIYDKYEMDHQIYNFPIIPRVMQMVSNDNNNKSKNNIDMNRSATIRPIYGIKRNQTTPMKSFKTFQSKEITLDKEIPDCNHGILSNEEYGENLIKPSAIKKLAKQFTLNSLHSSLPYQNQPQSPIPCKNQYKSSFTYEIQSQNQNQSSNQNQPQNQSPIKNEFPNQNLHQSENPHLNHPEHPIQREIQKHHVDLCKLVLNQCRIENNSRHIRPFFNELNEVKTKKSNGKDNVTQISHRMNCECDRHT